MLGHVTVEGRIEYHPSLDFFLSLIGFISYLICERDLSSFTWDTFLRNLVVPNLSFLYISVLSAKMIGQGILALTICSPAPSSGLRAISKNRHTSGSRVPILSPSQVVVTAEIELQAETGVLDGSMGTSMRFAKSFTLFAIGPAESQNHLMVWYA